MVLLDVLFIMLLLLFGVIVLLYLSIKHLTEKTERLFNIIQLQQKQIEYCQNENQQYSLSRLYCLYRNKSIMSVQLRQFRLPFIEDGYFYATRK